MTKAMWVATAAFVTLGAQGSCVGDVTSPHDPECEVTANTTWSELSLKLHTDESRYCPTGASPYDQIIVGGSVEDRTYDGSTLPDTWLATLTIYNKFSTEQCGTSFWGTYQGSESDFFALKDIDSDIDFEWVAGELQVMFSAGTGFEQSGDCAVFEVDVSALSPTPQAVMDILH